MKDGSFSDAPFSVQLCFDRSLPRPTDEELHNFSRRNAADLMMTLQKIGMRSLTPITYEEYRDLRIKAGYRGILSSYTLSMDINKPLDSYFKDSK